MIGATAGKGKRTGTLQADPHRLLSWSLNFPLIEPRRNHKTASALEGGPKGGLLRYGLGFGINALMPDLGVFGPGRNQAPAQLHQLTGRRTRLDPYRGYRL